mgnify:FL=1
MNCLHIDPNTLLRKIDPKLRDFNYTFLEILKLYEIPVEIYYHYLLSNEEYKLKNIWNITVNRWNTMNNELKEEPNLLNSSYHIKYNLNHDTIDDETLNDYLNEFVMNDTLKGLFLCNIIQGFIIPK